MIVHKKGSEVETIKNNRSGVQVEKQEDLLESSTDALEWKMEVERVMPSLKVHLRGDKVTVIA